MANDTTVKQKRVDELRAEIIKGAAEAEGLDMTNPERQRMMDAWCASEDPARADRKANAVCAKFKAKHDFFQRREKLIQFWCVEQQHSASPKCKQMDFGKKMQETSSGEERKRMAQDFNAERTPEALAGLETETKQMMQAACASALGQQSLFSATCAKLHTDTD